MKVHWAGYFERLYHADTPAVELDVMDVTIPIADPPINCDPPSFLESQAAVNRLKCGKAPGICGIHTELLKAGGNPVLMSLVTLHMFLIHVLLKLSSCMFPKYS